MSKICENNNVINVNVIIQCHLINHCVTFRQVVKIRALSSSTFNLPKKWAVKKLTLGIVKKLFF